MSGHIYRIKLLHWNARETKKRKRAKKAKKPEFLPFLLFLSFLFPPCLCFLNFANEVQAQDARKIMEGVYKQDTSRDTTWRGRRDVVKRKGTVRSKNFAMRKLGGLGNSKTLARFTDPPEVRGVGLLSINVGGG